MIVLAAWSGNSERGLGHSTKWIPHFSALLYAGDRFEAKSKIVTSLSRGAIVLADRYVASNLAHQTARVPARTRRFFDVIEHLNTDLRFAA